ncbi:MAG: NosD domain-containing protein, partial [Candidatus Woesearchaeota archaeon]
MFFSEVRLLVVRRRLLLSVLVLFLLFFLPSVFSQNYIYGCTVISNPGHYILANDIIDSPASVCIDIQANNVVLDCQGRMIDGVNSYNTLGIRISRSTVQVTNVTIMNCVVNQWDVGIYLLRARSNFLKNISFPGGIFVAIYFVESSDNIVKDISSVGSGYSNILRIASSSQNNLFSNLSINTSWESAISIFDSSSNQFVNISYFSSLIDNYGSISIGNSYYNQFVNVSLKYGSRARAVSVSASNDLHCNNLFSNVRGNNDQPIVFINNSVIIDGWNNNFSQLILCNADNSVIRNVFSNNNNNRDGIYVIRTDNLTIQNSTIINASYGVFMSISRNNVFNNLTLLDNYYYDFYVEASSSGECMHSVIDVIGTGNNPIRYYSSQVNLDGGDYSAIILCGAHGSILRNLRVGLSNKRNNGLLVILTNNSFFTNLTLERMAFSRLLNSHFNLFENVSIFNISSNCFELSSSSRNVFRNMNLSRCGVWHWGVLVQNSFYNNFSNIFITQPTGSGFHITYSTNNLFENITSFLCGGRGGFTFYTGGSNNILKDSVFLNNTNGIWIEYAHNNIIYNVTLINNSQYGVYFWGIDTNNTIRDSVISNNNLGGIFWHSTSLNSQRNFFINNIFNNTNNVVFSGALQLNYWNTTKTAGINIVGGPFLAGNYWATPSGTGFSETCNDFDYDGICDQPYQMQTLNIDHLPLKRLPFQMQKVDFITSCQNISESGYYFLANNLSVNGNCINITANNVVLNCQNRKIQGSNTGTGVSIVRSTQENA